MTPERLPVGLAWRLPLAFAALAVALFGLLVSSWQAYAAQLEAQRLRSRSAEVLGVVGALEIEVLPRAGRALCAASGQPVSPARDLAGPGWPPILDRLRMLLSDRSSELQRIERLGALLQSWELAFDDRLRRACRDRAPMGTSEVLQLAQAVVPLRDSVLQELTALRATEQALVAAREERLTDSGRQTRLWFTLAALAAGLLTLFTLVAVHGSTRQLIRANRRLLQEVDERRVAEQQLSAGQRRQRMVLEHLPDAVLAFDAGGRVLWVNPSGERLFGLPAGALVGEPLWLRVPALENELAWPDTQPQDDDTALPPWRTRRQRVTGRRHGQPPQDFPAEIALVQTRLEGDRLGVCIVRDLSESERVDRMKHEFVSVVSHELRTPLTSIRGSLSMLEDGMAGELPAAAARLVSLAHQNSERLVGLVNDILDYEKLSAGQMRLQMAALDLVDATARALEASEGYGHAHQVRLLLTAPPEPLWVQADADRLQQVLANLLSNAIKFSPERSEVKVNVACRAGDALVAVIDAGQGVPEAFRERLFQPFAQADGTNTRTRGGTGLGLAVSQALMTRMGGRIGLAPGRPGVGAVFWISLPLMTGAAPTATGGG